MDRTLPSRSEDGLTPARREVISAPIDTAVSSGVRAAIWIPMGTAPFALPLMKYGFRISLSHIEKR